VGIWRRAGEDFYVVLAAYDVSAQTAHLKLVVNPLVNWVWLGFGVLALGTIIALLPEKTYSFALEKVTDNVTAGAATAGMLLFAMVLTGATLRAQEPQGAPTAAASSSQSTHTTTLTTAPLAPRNEVEKRVRDRLVCLCGGCGKEPIGVCTCSEAARVRQEIASLVDQGQSEEQILQYFIDKLGGQQMLGAPLDSGFNRLLWLFPYLAGATGIVTVGVVAMRWSRRRESAPADAQSGRDELDDRLDDELRNLD
jgi:cytochrome c-type biogenesis protein CcmH/NrfF